MNANAGASVVEGALTPDAQKNELAPGTRVRDRRRFAESWLWRGERYGLVVLVVALIVLFAILEPDLFMTGPNWFAIGLSQSVTAILGLAVMLSLVTGNFDLSVGANALAASMLCAASSARYDLPLILGIVLPLAFGGVVGGFNGLLVTRARLNGLIATIGTATVLQALISWYTNNIPIATDIDPRLLEFGVASVAGIPNLVIVAAVCMLATHYLLTQTPFGRKLTAIGSNPKAAHLVGIRVNSHVFASYVAGGVLAGIAGVLMVAYQGSANPSTSGIAILIAALTVVFLGAAAIRPGEFNVPGLVIAILLTAVLVSGLTLRGVADWVSPLCYGAALIIGVGISAYFKARRVS